MDGRILDRLRSLQALLRLTTTHAYPFSIKPYFLHKFNSSLLEWLEHKVRLRNVLTAQGEIFRE